VGLHNTSAAMTLSIEFFAPQAALMGKVMLGRPNGPAARRLTP